MTLRHASAILLCALLPLAAQAQQHPATTPMASAAEADYMPSLITATPLEGRQLAITIVRRTVGAIQRNGEAKHRVREIYDEDPMMLMRAVELINLEFRIIAEANDYWRERPATAADRID